MWPKKNNHQNKLSNMNLKATMVAIATFLGFDTAQENVLTEEHVEKVNSELTRLQAENKKFGDDLVIANQSIETLKGEKTTLQTSLDEANGKVTAHEKIIAEQKTTIETLKQSSGNPAANVSVEKETGTVETDDALLNTVVKNEDDTAACLAEMRKAGYTSKK